MINPPALPGRFFPSLVTKGGAGGDLLGCAAWDCGTVLRMVSVAGMTVVKVLAVGRTGMVVPGLTWAIWENT